MKPLQETRMRVWHRSHAAEFGQSLQPESDSAQVAAAKANPAAFAPLYERYRDDVLRYSYHCLGDWEDAADAAQQTFTDAIAGLPKFQDRHNSFRCWLFRIAHNEVCTRQRQRNRRREQALAEADRFVDPARSPEDQAVVADDHRRIHVLLLELSPDKRRVCELRFAGLNDREVAQVLEKSEGAVRTAFSRGLAELRDLLGVQIEQKRARHG
jgi:RNA polymerase sigma-70 factor, ECF subfamily